MRPCRPFVHLVVVLLVTVGGVGCGGGGNVGGGGAGAGREVVASVPDTSPREGATAGSGTEAEAGGPGVVVDVAGSVRRPGVYRLPPGSRVHEAIDAAGGARRGAQLGTLNRAAILQDGQQVLVQSTNAQAADTPRSGGAGAGTTVNLNVADAAALDALPGIGMVTAERIVADREASGPFASVDDLDRVPGIGPATVDALREVATT